MLWWAFIASRLWICLDQVCGMSGITTHTRKLLFEIDGWSSFKFLFVYELINFCLSNFLPCSFNYRMSIEMVACIAIEAISILEKMHSKGWYFYLYSDYDVLFLYYKYQWFFFFTDIDLIFYAKISHFIESDPKDLYLNNINVHCGITPRYFVGGSL